MFLCVGLDTELAFWFDMTEDRGYVYCSFGSGSVIYAKDATLCFPLLILPVVQQYHR